MGRRAAKIHACSGAAATDETQESIPTDAAKLSISSDATKESISVLHRSNGLPILDWYPRLKHVALETHFIPVTRSFLQYLVDDEASLPTADTIPPSLQDIWDDLEAVTQDLVECYPRLQCCGPRDASWIMPDSTPCARSALDVVKLLKMSERVLQCSNELLQTFETPVVLALRLWHKFSPDCEFRCFIHDNILVGCSARLLSAPLPQIDAARVTQVCSAVTRLLELEDFSFTSSSSFVLDVYVTHGGTVKILDIGRFGQGDSLLYDWDDLLARSEYVEEVLVCDGDRAPDVCQTPLEFRMLAEGDESASSILAMLQEAGFPGFGSKA